MLTAADRIAQIWQSWLVPATAEDLEHQRAHRAAVPSADDHHAHEHEHGHFDHGDHVHEGRAQVEQNAVDAEGDAPERSRLTQAFIKVVPGADLIRRSYRWTLPSTDLPRSRQAARSGIAMSKQQLVQTGQGKTWGGVRIRVRFALHASHRCIDLRQVATAKGILSAADITKRIERLQGFGRDFVGAAIVARAWTDAGFRARLLDDGITAAAELGAFTGGFPARGGTSGPTWTLYLIRNRGSFT